MTEAKEEAIEQILRTARLKEKGLDVYKRQVVTDPKRAAVILRWMVTEMEKRYRLFAEKGVRDIGRYNQSADKKMPYIAVSYTHLDVYKRQIL